ncbi:MAG: toxin-antitoxin system HicB family antitoxin [Blastocatellia bacterium]
MMTTITANLPDSLLRRAKRYAEREGMSLDQFLAMALSGQLSSLDTVRAVDADMKRKGWEKMRELLANAPDVEPAEEDRLN